MTQRQAVDEACFLLARTATQWRRVLNQALEEPEMTAVQYLVLEATARIGDEGAPQQRIADRIGMDKMTASQVLKGLAAHGLVERRRPRGRRDYRIRITAKGKEMLAYAREYVDNAADAFWAPAGKHLAEINAALDRVFQHACKRTADYTETRRFPPPKKSRR